MNTKKLQSDLKNYFEQRGLKTSVSIAKATKIGQPTVYRSLYKNRPRLTKGLVRLCDYAKIDLNFYLQKDAASNKYLMEALNTVWNGTDAHAKQLSRLLLTAHSCKLNGSRAEVLGKD